MKTRIFNYFSNPKRIVVLNGILLAIAITGNSYIQVFCNPTNWATILLIICFANSIFFPLLIKNEKLLPVVSLINGISFCLFLYCIIFLEQMNFFGLIFILIGIGLITFIPHFFAIQLLWKGFIKLPSKSGRKYFIAGVCIALSLPIISGVLYHNALSDMEDFKESDYQILSKNFMTEKIIGMGIIYHVRFCEYDGWRPPKHEPILNLGLWLNGRKDPLNIDLEKRVNLYKKFFPERKLKFDCSCAYSYKGDYHNDQLWK
jgi:hypothetical protein